MEILMLVAVPLVTSLLAPIALELVGKAINKRKEDAEVRRTDFTSVLDADKHNDQVAAELRRELRDENVSLKKTNSELERAAANANARAAEAEKWEARFYALKKEKQSLEFELILVKKELEQFRRQYEQYAEVRDRARSRVEGSDDE